MLEIIKMMLTRMSDKMMPSRMIGLSEVMEGFNRTGIPLVAFDGKTFKPIGSGDDIGIYFAIPYLAKFLNISYKQCIGLFLITIIIVATVLGICGLYLLVNKKSAWFLSSVYLALFSLEPLKIGEVYIFSYSTVIAIMPFLIYLLKNKLNTNLLKYFVFILGFCVSISHYFRSHSGTAVILFLMVYIFFCKEIYFKKKLALMVILLIGLSLPVAYFENMLYQRNVYLSNVISNYKPPQGKHPFWHSVYIGLGYINNSLGLFYKDECAFEKVKFISPSTECYSAEYENILKNEVFKLFYKYPNYIIHVIFAKIGECELFILIFANIGLIAFFFNLNGNNLLLNISFISAIIFSSLFGILVVPQSNYLLGLITFSFVFGLYNIIEFVQNDKFNKLMLLR